MKAIIIDDEPLARMIVKEYLSDYKDIELVAECSDGFEALKAIQKLQPDLLFLDIQMPKINGFELLELLDEPPLVVFTTAFEEYAIRAFEAHASDYLLKPFSKERFDKAMVKLPFQKRGNALEVTSDGHLKGMQHNRIVVKDNGKIKIIPVGQVNYIEAKDDYVKIFCADGHYLKRQTMQFYEDSLPAGEFIRIHRSYILNASLITRIDLHEKDGHLVLLTSGERLPVSKSGYARLKEVLGI